jgi:hypothetical protein
MKAPYLNDAPNPNNDPYLNDNLDDAIDLIYK